MGLCYGIGLIGDLFASVIYVPSEVTFLTSHLPWRPVSDLLHIH